MNNKIGIEKKSSHPRTLARRKNLWFGHKQIKPKANFEQGFVIFSVYNFNINNDEFDGKDYFINFLGGFSSEGYKITNIKYVEKNTFYRHFIKYNRKRLFQLIKNKEQYTQIEITTQAKYNYN